MAECGTMTCTYLDFHLLDRGARGGAKSRKVVGLIPDGAIGIFH
jgi:hypothetical protein